MAETNKPEKKFSFGGITATVWKNTIKGPNGDFDVRNVDIQRSYKDKDGNWQNSPSLRQADLPKAMVALQKAYEHCLTVGKEE